MVGDAEGVVALAVEFVGDAPEVAYHGERDGGEAVEEVIHVVAAEGDHGTEGHAFAHFEVGDAFAGFGDDGLLAAEFGEFFDDFGLVAFVGFGFEGGVENDFDEGRDLVAVLITAGFS